MGSGMNELQILRDELDVGEPARGIFQIPAIRLALLGRDRHPHLVGIARDCTGIALLRHDGADQRLDRFAEPW